MHYTFQLQRNMEVKETVPLLHMYEQIKSLPVL